jgi:VWFA-related protein
MKARLTTRSLISVAIVSTAMISVSVVADAQRTRGSEAATFRADVREVLVDVTVERKGHLVSALTKEDFHVFQDQAERPIISCTRDELPVAVALVVDRSPSMLPVMHEMQNAAAEVLAGLKANDQVALFAFDEAVEKIVDLTSDRKRASSVLQSVSRRGPSTDILNALFVATLYLSDAAPDSRRVVILVSDDEAPRSTVTSSGVVKTEQDFIDLALARDVAVYNVRVSWRRTLLGWTDTSVDPRLIAMKTITQQTGGDSEEGSTTPAALHKITSALRSRYTLAFRPETAKSDRQIHSIEVRLDSRLDEHKKYSLHYRRGFRLLNEGSGNN